ncbi:MAG: hypothetical protein U0939_04025 [Pirellulales bacterium]
MTRLATDIEVEVFHDTLIWPLLLRGAEDIAGIDRFLEAFGAAGWREAEDGLSVHRDFEYDEIVYFHPFVRDFLFGDGATKVVDRTVRRFVRRDVSQVEVEIKTGKALGETTFTACLKVERVELWLMRPRIAMLVVEISNRRPEASVAIDRSDARSRLSLAQVLYLQSQLRNIYPPFFEGDRHGDCPVRVVWKGLPAVGDELRPSVEDLSTFVRIGAEPPMYAHWRAFFGKGVAPMSSANDRQGEVLCLQQLLDHRIPSFSFIGVESPGEISQDDEDRLPAFDTPDLIYDRDFRSRHRDRLRYTRFRHWGTSYYSNGTSMAMVTKRGDFQLSLLRHYRRHYLHLAVIAQYQHAALLYFADELADIAKKLAMGEKESPERDCRDKIRSLQHRFLKFRTRSYFTEVSHQIQGQELFAFWLEHLRTHDLFERVSQTNSEVYEALENFEMREIAQEQTKMSVAQTRMTDIATKVIPWSIALAVVSLFFDWLGGYPDDLRSHPTFTGKPVWGPWMWLSMAMFLAFSAYCGSASLIEHWRCRTAGNSGSGDS